MESEDILKTIVIFKGYSLERALPEPKSLNFLAAILIRYYRF